MQMGHAFLSAILIFILIIAIDWHSIARSGDRRRHSRRHNLISIECYQYIRSVKIASIRWWLHFHYNALYWFSIDICSNSATHNRSFHAYDSSIHTAHTSFRYGVFVFFFSFYSFLFLFGPLSFLSFEALIQFRQCNKCCAKRVIN